MARATLWSGTKWSLPVRECGLKLPYQQEDEVVAAVTPRAGVWIEIPAWCGGPRRRSSLPVRECGLKWDPCQRQDPAALVTPRAGVWIEIRSASGSLPPALRHSPCGSVD